uniref:phosphoethanolamine N-methyltransferase n=1 Tax=Pseudodiaptomus poplesia TaxID=213370 RepID=A0A0U2V908_9MAXI|nr:phosphoethanolamine N-methyltransferase 3 [Pseudodiaptomus poplesia]
MPPLNESQNSVEIEQVVHDQDTAKVQKWLDHNQYSKNGILRYEKIFGRTFVSTGGEKTTRKYTEMLDLKPSMQVLDICCGTGGSAFFMAREYEVSVHGVDLSTNMLQLANNYRAEMEPEVKHRVQFHEEDVTKMSYPREFYNCVYSRDAIMHIPNKLALYKKFYETLKPGGKVLVTDYCIGSRDYSPKFGEYLKDRGYHLVTVDEYRQILVDAGFKEVKAIDTTDMFLEVLHEELDHFLAIEKEFVEEFSKEDFDWIVKGWKIKIERCGQGEQRWGLVMGTK